MAFACPVPHKLRLSRFRLYTSYIAFICLRSYFFERVKRRQVYYDNSATAANKDTLLNASLVRVLVN